MHYVWVNPLITMYMYMYMYVACQWFGCILHRNQAWIHLKTHISSPIPRFHFVMLYRWMRIEQVQNVQGHNLKIWMVASDLPGKEFWGKGVLNLRSLAITLG